MADNIGYNSQNIIGQNASAVTVNTTEIDITTITDITLLKNSQISAYVTYALGTNTSIEFRVYYRMETGGTWFSRPKWTTADNTLDDQPFIADGNTPGLNFVYEFPLASCFAMKITAKGAGGAGSTVSVKILSRDN